jgi:hypothetical protein
MITVVVDLYIYGHRSPPVALDTAFAPSLSLYLKSYKPKNTLAAVTYDIRDSGAAIRWNQE